jgi:hypothetical protein
VLKTKNHSWRHAYCQTCESVQPVTIAVMVADDPKEDAAADIVCHICRGIIATLHERSATASSDRRSA